MTTMRKYIIFILLTLIAYQLAYYLVIFPHEWSHATIAWLFGFQTSPFAIDYGGSWSLTNILLPDVDENVNYYLLYLTGHFTLMGFIGLAGPIFYNFGGYLVSLFLLSRKQIIQHKWLFYILFWYSLCCLREVLAFIPCRTFETHDDMAHVAMGFGISPWWIFAIGMPVVLIGFWHLFYTQIPKLYSVMKSPKAIQRSFICLFWFLLIFPLTYVLQPNYSHLAHIMASSAMLILTLASAACWPAWSWMQRRIQTVRQD